MRILEENRSEKYYKNALLLNKIKKSLTIHEKQYIFNKGYCWDILLKDYFAPKLCFNYSKYIIQKRFPEGEPYIVKDPFYACLYAIRVLGRRFPEGEDIISKHHHVAYYYAKNVLNNRWIEAENIILNSISKEKYLFFLTEIGQHL